VIAALKSEDGVPENSTIAYLRRAARTGVLEKNGRLYRLPPVPVETLPEDDAASDTDHPDDLLDVAPPPPAAPKSRETVLDFIRRAGSMGVGEFQLEHARISLAEIEALLEDGEIECVDERYYVIEQAAQ